MEISMNIPTSFKKAARTALTGAAIFGALGAVAAFAQDAAAPAVEAVEAVVEAAVPTPDKGDTTWMLLSTILVIAMTIPGLALFYGGLVR
jgi:Amt family ammonium transporter